MLSLSSFFYPEWRLLTKLDRWSCTEASSPPASSRSPSRTQQQHFAAKHMQILCFCFLDVDAKTFRVNTCLCFRSAQELSAHRTKSAAGVKENRCGSGGNPSTVEFHAKLLHLFQECLILQAYISKLAEQWSRSGEVSERSAHQLLRWDILRHSSNLLQRQPWITSGHLRLGAAAWPPRLGKRANALLASNVFSDECAPARCWDHISPSTPLDTQGSWSGRRGCRSGGFAGHQLGQSSIWKSWADDHVKYHHIYIYRIYHQHIMTLYLAIECQAFPLFNCLLCFRDTRRLVCIPLL